MSIKIDNWDFLFGKWQSVKETQVGDSEGATNYTEINPYPSNKYISMRNTTKVGDNITAHGLSQLYYDDRENKYKLKSFFGYGFVVSYEEIEHSDEKIIFKSAEIESQPEDFDGTQFRYTLSKLNESLFDIHLEMKQPGKDYFTFWKANYQKTS